ncbi:MAG: DNA recombination protein RmuC [Clostridium sp.]|nr:DNA recombination protein RmuC [Clostridium sp.]
MILTVILLSLALCAAVARIAFISATVKPLKSRIAALESTVDTIQREKTAAAAALAAAEREQIRASERVASLGRELENARRTAEENERNFSRLATVALEEQGRKFREGNEQRLAEILQPLRENIDSFRARIEECYSSEARERFALQKVIDELMNQSRNIGKEARQLTSALKGDTRAQGEWGEIVLERMLEESGLRRGHEFTTQLATDGDGNRLRNDDGTAIRPDVAVFLPEGRAIVIDSKVSLTAYTRWISTEDDSERRTLGRAHVDSVRKHINELRDKRYQDFVGECKLDFVMMFMPSEGSYMAAMSLDESLWQYAFDNHVLIVSPTHLVSVLRLTAQLWATDRQNANAMKIAEEAGRIHNKIVAFIDDMNQVYASISRASATWQKAMNKLSTGRGNLLKKTDELRRLGARNTRRLGVDFDDPDEDDDSGTAGSIID